MKRRFTIFVSGVIASLLLLSVAQANPHDRLIATDEAGQEWNLLLAPPARNRRFGFGEGSVDVGDVIEILGQRHPNRLEMKVHCIDKDGKNLYTYRYDNGRTSLERTRSKDSCT